ncbi:polysaccharide export outer membrane protein [Zhouia amylolytica]|uniref:Polysaccharide export outer membrane protein n=1 Tax=Zhouia amylolytica TaxID=376730 RepID=A0A1I6VKT9_9FLAO|nr:polysaccharide biosynthesis/export family protein [Zhouia amylolytica]MCQ0112272.1 polysaccharide biosynthesis/export family protein [Zhouia amylolytica]SFT14279.1 polysaccharide export outer membrane protein [Zhouia amylolytica]
MNLRFSTFKKVCYTVLLSLFFTACASREDVVYMQNAKKFETVVNTDTFEPKLKVDDILSIYVSASDPESVKPFNLIKGITNTGNPQELDYLIDKEGNIDFPVLGKVELVGLTTEQAKQKIREILQKDYLKDPIVNMRIKNFRVTILGEVNKPGTYTVDSERVTIFEALGLAGDLKIKGKRDNVLVIRDFNGTKTYTRVDLTSKALINSPVYFLTQNDVVYVEPNKSAITSASLDNRVTIAVSILSMLVTSAVVIITNSN